MFKVDQSVLTQCQRAARNDALSDDNLPLCGSSDESDTDAGETLWWDSRLALQFFKEFSKDKSSFVFMRAQDVNICLKAVFFFKF